MKKRYFAPEFQIIQTDVQQPVLTMSINDLDTNTQFAPEKEHDLLFEDLNIVP